MKQMKATIVILYFFSLFSWAGSIQISTSPVIFGRYSSFDPNDLQGSGEIEILCLPDNINSKDQVMCVGSLSIGLSSGKSGNVFNRKLYSTNMSNFLEYNLFTDSNKRTIWGDINGEPKHIKYRLRMNASESYTVFGLIKAKQYAPYGIYQDSLTVSIDF
jgi:spore coat protein U-like protein